MATVLQCDHCKSVKYIKTVRVFRRRDSSGSGASDDVDLTADLCQKCRDAIFFKLISRNSRDEILDGAAEIITDMGVGKEM